MPVPPACQQLHACAAPPTQQAAESCLRIQQAGGGDTQAQHTLCLPSISTMQSSAGRSAVNISTAGLPAGAPPVAPSSCAAFSAARLESVETAATYSCRSKLTRGFLMEGSHIARMGGKGRPGARRATGGLTWLLTADQQLMFSRPAV